MTSTERSGAMQRRGKKDSHENENNNNESSSPLETQLAQAQAAVARAEQQTQLLHQQWRTYLLRFSYLLILVSMHQMQGPTSACVKDIKALNAASAQEEQISGARAFVLAVSDSFPYILAITMSAFLSLFLSLKEPGNFSDPRYLLANALLPPLIGMHFLYKDEPSCLHDEALLARIDPEPRTRSLPVVVVYHVIVTVCCWFMDNQRQQQARNIRMVQDLQRDLTRAKKGNNKTTTTTTTTTRSSRSKGKKKN